MTALTPARRRALQHRLAVAVVLNGAFCWWAWWPGLPTAPLWLSLLSLVVSVYVGMLLGRLVVSRHAEPQRPRGLVLRGMDIVVQLDGRLTYEGKDAAGVHRWICHLTPAEVATVREGRGRLHAKYLPGRTGINFRMAEEQA